MTCARIGFSGDFLFGARGKIKKARVTTADGEQTAVAAFLPWRDS
jgi:hypothetical protein